MIKKSDQRGFSRAASVSALSDYRKFNVGCVAVDHGRVLSVGFNTTKTHPAQKRYNQFRDIVEGNCDGTIHHSLHAEIMCLNGLSPADKSRADHIKLYIYRQRRDQPHGLARPCKACMAAIREFGIRHIYYTTNDGYASEVLF